MFGKEDPRDKPKRKEIERKVGDLTSTKTCKNLNCKALVKHWKSKCPDCGGTKFR